MSEKPVASATISHEWQHPSLGRIREVLCNEHDKAVLSALHVLGIGSMGERVSDAGDCKRCAAAALGVTPRVYVRMITGSEVSL